MSHLAAALATLAVLAQVALGGLDGTVCIRMAPFPPSGGCTTRCCEHEQAGDSAFVVASDQGDGLPSHSECCVEVGDSANFLQGTDYVDVRGAGEFLLPVPAIVTGFGCDRSPITVAAGEAAHLPPGLVVIRTTVLLI